MDEAVNTENQVQCDFWGNSSRTNYRSLREGCHWGEVGNLTDSPEGGDVDTS